MNMQHIYEHKTTKVDKICVPAKECRQITLNYMLAFLGVSLEAFEFKLEGDKLSWKEEVYSSHKFDIEKFTHLTKEQIEVYKAFETLGKFT